MFNSTLIVHCVPLLVFNYCIKTFAHCTVNKQQSCFQLIFKHEKKTNNLYNYFGTISSQPLKKKKKLFSNGDCAINTLNTSKVSYLIL